MINFKRIFFSAKLLENEIFEVSISSSKTDESQFSRVDESHNRDFRNIDFAA